MLKVTDLKKAKGTMDAQVKSMVCQICKLWDEIYDLNRLFDVEIRKIKKVNYVAPQHAYKLIQKNETTIELWHIEPVNLIPDRLLFEVKYHPDIDESNLS